MKLVVSVLIKFIGGLIVGVVDPLISTITNILPTGVDSALSMVANFFTWLLEFVLFVLSWLPFTSTFWAFIISCVVFKISLSVTLDLIKIVVKWWHALAP